MLQRWVRLAPVLQTLRLFSVTTPWMRRGFSGLPRAVVLPGITRSMLLTEALPAPPASSLGGGDSNGSSLVALNTCTSDTLAEILRHLKRSYWPLPWDTSSPSASPGGPTSASGAMGHEGSGGGGDSTLSHGGFRPAAKAACGDQMSAQLAAVSRPRLG